MLNVVMLSVTTLSVVAPLLEPSKTSEEHSSTIFKKFLKKNVKK